MHPWNELISAMNPMTQRKQTTATSGMAPAMNKIMQPVATTLWANLVLVTLSKSLKCPTALHLKN